MYLLPSAWGKGIGRRLMDVALARLAEAQFDQVTLWVLDSNARARRFYEAGGWLADGAQKTEESRGFPIPRCGTRGHWRHLGRDPFYPAYATRLSTCLVTFSDVRWWPYRTPRPQLSCMAGPGLFFPQLAWSSFPAGGSCRCRSSLRTVSPSGRHSSRLRLPGSCSCYYFSRGRRTPRRATRIPGRSNRSRPPPRRSPVPVTTGATAEFSCQPPLASATTSVTSAAGSVINSAAKPVTAAIACSRSGCCSRSVDSAARPARPPTSSASAVGAEPASQAALFSQLQPRHSRRQPQCSPRRQPSSAPRLLPRARWLQSCPR